MLAVAVLGAVTLVVIPNATGAITSGPHDLRSRLGIDQICVPCHEPHNAREGDSGPIWNHAVTDETFMRNGEEVTISLKSKRCLGCHDGVTALGSYGPFAGDDPITGGAAIGTELTDDHPISVDYPVGGHGMNDPTLPAVAKLIVDGKVECGSCHSTHSASLKVTMVGSALCLTCHAK
jgi:predicted CXXCH cytochrome family protein